MKPKPNIQVPRNLDRDISVASKHDKQEKEGGLTLTTPHDWKLPGKMGMLKKGGRFVECNDVWFWCYTVGGERLHFTINRITVDIVMQKKEDDVAA